MPSKDLLENALKKSEGESNI